MKIFVAIPASQHMLDCNVHASLVEELKISFGVGDEIIVDYFPSSGGIADGRNHLANDFLKSDCEKMVFLDSDISFAPGSLVMLAHKPVDFVGGCYRYKKEEEDYPIRFKDKGDLWADKNGLIEVAGLPFGFVCLSRKVFEKFDETFPERKDKNFGLKSNVYFQLPLINGALWGEDYIFAKEWSDMGGKIYLDPDIHLTHWSYKPTPFKGHIGNWLRNKPESVKRKEEIIKEKNHGL